LESVEPRQDFLLAALPESERDRWQVFAITGSLYIGTQSTLMTITPADLIGWASTVVLLATIGRQVYSQWKSKATAGVSRWLFVGQISASIGFTIYSLLLDNWVFLFSNAAILITAIAGELIYISNRRRQGH